MVRTNVRRINLLDVKCLQTNQPKPAKASAASQPNPRLLFPALLTRRVSPPRPPPGHPRVVPILHPPNWWHPIQPTDRRPPAPKLPEHPADPRRPLKPRSTHLHRPRRPRDLRASEPQPLDQPRLAYDLGCGPGNSTELLIERFPQARIIGVDSSPDMLAKARRSHPKAEFARVAGHCRRWHVRDF